MRSRFMALFVALMMMGPAMVALAADGPQPDPNSADRTDNAHVNILDITGYPDDDDGNGLYDGVQVVSRVNFTRSGNYYLHVKFMPTDGSWWLSAAETQNIEKVPTDVYFEVRFEGWKIRNRNYTGYLVAEVSILDPANNNAILATHSETLDRYFRVWEWEPTWTGARVTGFDRAVSKDFDGNGTPEAFEQDFNSNGTPDVFEFSWLERVLTDFNKNGSPDGFEDFNGDGSPDAFEDFNGNGPPDGFEEFPGYTMKERWARPTLQVITLMRPFLNQA